MASKASKGAAQMRPSRELAYPYPCHPWSQRPGSGRTQFKTSMSDWQCRAPSGAPRRGRNATMAPSRQTDTIAGRQNILQYSRPPQPRGALPPHSVGPCPAPDPRAHSRPSEAIPMRSTTMLRCALAAAVLLLAGAAQYQAIPPAAAAPAAALLPLINTGPGKDSECGKLLAQARGCMACHSVDGSPGVGPTWKAARPLWRTMPS
eukprot:gene40355-49907_t